MTLSKTDVNVLSRDISNMPFYEKLESCSWILSQYPDNNEIRKKRAIIYYNIGLFAYSFEDCCSLLDRQYVSDEIIAIYNVLNKTELELDEKKWNGIYNSAPVGYSSYLKGLFYIQCSLIDSALNELLVAAKRLPDGFFKIDTNMRIGDIYFEKLRYEDALIYYKKANKLYHNNEKLHVRMFEIYLKMKNVEAAKKELQIIRNLTEDSDLYKKATILLDDL